MPIDFQVPMVNLAILSDVPLSNDEESTGICMAISCFWVQRCRQLLAVPDEDDLFFTNWQHYETMAVAYETLLADYNLEAGGDGTIESLQHLQSNSRTWHNMFFSQLGLPPMDMHWRTDDALDYLLALMDGGGMRGYILSGYETETTDDGDLQLISGHTVAFWYSNPGTVKTFMDPNDGQYTAAHNSPWNEQLIEHLHNNDNFNHWVLFRIG